MRRPFIFTSLSVVRGESKRGNRKCGPENTFSQKLAAHKIEKERKNKEPPPPPPPELSAVVFWCERIQVQVI